MAIEIVRVGQLPSQRRYKGTCYYCETEAKWLEKDAKKIYHGNQRDPERSSTVDCPLCGKSMTGYAQNSLSSGYGYFDR